MSLEHAPARQTRIISRREFRKRLGGISRATEFRESKKGHPNWPRLVYITGLLTGYFEDEADRYIASRPPVRPTNGAEDLEQLEAGAGP
jgi:predicted DNA-binding transcriptional regulator AlpA